MDSEAGPTRQIGLSKGRHGFTERETLQWKNTHMGSPEDNQAIWTPSPLQGLKQILGLASDCSAQSDCRGCRRILNQGLLSGVRGNGKMAQRDTGLFFPPLPYYPTHKDCRISSRCSMLPSLQLYGCLPERLHTPTYMRRRRRHRVSSHPGGTARMASKAMASTIQWANHCLETAFPFC